MPGHPHGSGHAGGPSLSQATEQDASFTGGRIPIGQKQPKGCFTGNKLLSQFQIPPSLLLSVTVLSSLLALAEPTIQETQFEGRLELRITDLLKSWISTNTLGLWSIAIFPLAPLCYKSINDFSIPQCLRFNSLRAFSTHKSLLFFLSWFNQLTYPGVNRDNSISLVFSWNLRPDKVRA